MASTMRFDRWEDTLGNSVNMTQVSGGSGLVPIVPTSVVVGSGSASVGANGIISITGASSISLNSIFTTTYRSYRVAMNISVTAGTDIQGRFRANGTDSSTGYYDRGYLNTSTFGVYTRDNANAKELMWASGPGAVGSFVWEINEPSDSSKLTTYHETGYLGYTVMLPGVHNSAASYDGVTVFSTAGNFTGTVQVYGYR